MEKRIVVSGGGMLRSYAQPCGGILAKTPLEGAGALCACGRTLYAACGREGLICRMDADTLAITGLFAGGPGVCQLIASADGARLYALCAEADSLLMLSGETGAPMVVCRAGVNPCSMAMDGDGRVIAAAGGAAGEVLLVDAALNTLVRLQTPGVTFSAALCGETVYALSLSETMDSVLSAYHPGAARKDIPLPGMPGALLAEDGMLLAATHHALYAFALPSGKRLAALRVPGRAGRLIRMEEGLLMTDQWSDTLFFCGRDMRWCAAARGVSDAVLL